MAWSYYNLTRGHCLKGVGHLSNGCETFSLGVHDIWLNPWKPKPFEDDVHYQKNIISIFSWIEAKIEN